MTAHNKTLSESLLVWDEALRARPYAYVTDSVRTSASTVLRLKRKPVRYATFDLPPYFDLKPGDVVYTNHNLMPEVATGTDRFDTWRLIPLHVVEVYDPLAVPNRVVKCADFREVYASYWSPYRTDIGMTDDLNGIAILDRAGGGFTNRNQVGYGIRPPADDAWQEVLANTAIIDAHGLRIEGGTATNHLLNSTFSEGSGTTYTNWTATTSGSAFVAEWTLYTLIDAAGFRRTLQLVTQAAGEACYVSQTVNTMQNKTMAVKVYYKDGGAVDRMGLRISRSDTGEYLDSTGTWQGSTQTITLTPGSGVIETLRYVTPAFSTTSGGTVNLTISVGHFSAAYAGTQISQPQGVELLEITRIWQAFRSPLPTKAAAVSHNSDFTALDNSSAVQVLSPTRGFFKCTIRPSWSHGDLSDSDIMRIWSADFDGGTGAEYLRCYYQRVDGATGVYHFQNGDLEDATLTATTLPVAEDSYVVICRWTSEALNEHGLNGQALDIWVDGVRGTTAEGATTQIADAETYVRLGSTVGQTDQMLEGHLYDVTIGDHCPSEAELLRL